MSERIPENVLSKAVAHLDEGRGRKATKKQWQVGRVETDRVSSSGQKVFRVELFETGRPNGARPTVVIDESGEAVDLGKLAKKEGRELFAAAPPRRVETPPAASPGAAVSIEPKSNDLVLPPGERFDETVTVTVPGGAGASKVDVYLLADTTGSMGSVLEAVRNDAGGIVSALSAAAPDVAFGVGSYKDFPGRPDEAFRHQQKITAVAGDVTGAIGTWAADGGADPPEGQLYALDQVAEDAGGSIGWRAGAKRILLWFGDAPGHDPVCRAISGLSYDVDEASVTAKLAAAGITVLAISTTTGTAGALDGDPTQGGDYQADCGAPGGRSGQASRICAATGGRHVSGVDAASIVRTILDLVSTAASSLGNLKLVASGATAPFVVEILPPDGYGPSSGEEDRELGFRVRFVGKLPCEAEDRVFKGSLDAVADGVVVARKPVKVTVPACERRAVYSYSVKFVCGVQEAGDCCCGPVVPGLYATEINLYNPQGTPAVVQKRVVPLVLSGAAAGREPRRAGVTATDRIVLPARTATLDDCCRLGELLFGAPTHGRQALSIGFLEIVSNVELAVTAVYTAADLEGRSVSLDVEQVQGRRTAG